MARITEYPRSLAGLSGALRTGEVSPVEVTEGMLDRIGADRTNAFITVTAERAMEDARRAEAEISGGRYRGPLHGVPVAIKDLVSTGGVRTTMASAFFESHVPDRAAAVARLLREVGSVLLGKTNTHEFAYGPTGDRSFFGPTRNPHDPARISGGSSGGSGTAVATGLCYGAIGSDTGGSIRIPAALCGVVGMKPTFGRVGKSGVFPLASHRAHADPTHPTREGTAPPPPRRPWRRRRHEADLRPRGQERRLPTGLDPRPRGPHDPHRRRQRPAPLGARRPRPARPRLRGP